jgi:hypothetical protein
MKKITQPETLVRFSLPNGVRLIVRAYARAIHNSSRIDSPIREIDWGSINTSLHLEIDADRWTIGDAEIIRSTDLDEEDALEWFEEDALRVATALGSAEYAETIKNAFFEARAKILALKA